MLPGKTRACCKFTHFCLCFSSASFFLFRRLSLQKKRCDDSDNDDDVLCRVIKKDNATDTWQAVKGEKKYELVVWAHKDIGWEFGP